MTRPHPNQHTGHQIRARLKHCLVADADKCPECGSGNIRIAEHYGICQEDGCREVWEIPHVNEVQVSALKRWGRGKPLKKKLCTCGRWYKPTGGRQKRCAGCALRIVPGMAFLVGK